MGALESGGKVVQTGCSHVLSKIGVEWAPWNLAEKSCRPGVLMCCRKSGSNGRPGIWRKSRADRVFSCVVENRGRMGALESGGKVVQTGCSHVLSKIGVEWAHWNL